MTDREAAAVAETGESIETIRAGGFPGVARWLDGLPPRPDHQPVDGWRHARLDRITKAIEAGRKR